MYGYQFIIKGNGRRQVAFTYIAVLLRCLKWLVWFKFKQTKIYIKFHLCFETSLLSHHAFYTIPLKEHHFVYSLSLFNILTQSKNSQNNHSKNFLCKVYLPWSAQQWELFWKKKTKKNRRKENHFSHDIIQKLVAFFQCQLVG